MPWNENFTLEQFKKANRDNTEPYMYVRGKTASGNEVWGAYVGMDAGICLSIYVNNKIFRIINDFSYTTTMQEEMIYTVNENIDMDHTIYHQLTPWTIHFWLSAGYNTKHYLTTYELKNLRILDAMSEEGLSRLVKPAPILHANVGGHSYIRATKSDKDYFQSDESEFFIETGELPPHEEGHMAPRPIASRISIKNNEQNNKWHLTRAQHFRNGRDARVELKSGCEKYYTSYTFDDDRHILLVHDVNPLRETSFQVRLPAHPSSTINSVVGSPASPFVLREPIGALRLGQTSLEEGGEPPNLSIADHNHVRHLQMSPFAIHALPGQMSPIADIYSLESTRIMRPTPIRVETYKGSNEQCDSNSQYTDLITGLAHHHMTRIIPLIEQKSTEEEQYESYDDKVARLSTQQIAEGLETHHRTIKRFYRKYQDHDITPPIEEELYHAEEWCMAAYMQLRMRR